MNKLSANSANRINNNAAVANLPLISLITLLFSLWIFLFVDIYIISKLGIILCVITALKFVDVLGRAIPIRELIVLLMLLQLVVAPVISYNYFGNESYYPMEVEEGVYIDYVLFGIVASIIGLYLKANPRKTNVTAIIDKIRMSRVKNNKLGISLIFIGFASFFILPIVPASVQFFFLLLSNLRFIGLFYIVFSNNRYRLIWLLIVYGSFAYYIIGEGLFINLFVWGLFLFIILSFQYEFRYGIRLGLFISGFLIAFFVQTFKEDYRKVVWKEEGEQEYVKSLQKGEKTKQDVFLEMAAERAGDTEEIYEYSNLNKFIARINQGWILTHVFNHVPSREPFTNGTLLIEDISASLIPRFLNPGKRTSGGEYGREKFMRFTGRYLQEGTRMTIGTFGDAYVNFGFYGGIVFMFFFGLFLNLILKYIYSLSQNIYPSLMLWIPFIFLYAMRSGNEFLIILNHIVKSSFVVFVIFFLFRSSFRSAKILDRTK